RDRGAPRRARLPGRRAARGRGRRRRHARQPARGRGHRALRRLARAHGRQPHRPRPGHINVFGSEALRRRYLPRMGRGEWLGAWCLTEPGSGSYAAELRTRAVRDGDSWVLNGAKMFITQGTVAHVYVVMAATAPVHGQRGISTFVVEKGVAGLSNGRKIEKLGLRSSDTAEVILENVRVPAEHLIG